LSNDSSDCAIPKNHHRRFYAAFLLTTKKISNPTTTTPTITPPIRGQFTGEAFTGLLKQRGIRISMDGKGSYNDNLFIERLWRTVKYEEVYLKAYQDGRDARIGLGSYFSFYNAARPHQTLDYRTPAEVFTSIPMESTEGGMVESLTTDPLRIAGPALSIAPILS
jgi:putative transposase